MFYSHQLLARKAPLGQIWMAATLDSKIKRRNLEKLDIPRICEEILNPSIPMALRLSGILMGGVVNVYKRKVDFLYDDANRFLEDFNKTFRAKSNANDYSSKTQAKRKAQARSEAAITIDDKTKAEFDENIYASSDSLHHAVRFQRMTLEDMDDHYINIDIGNEDLSAHHHHHQADPADITLPDKLEFSSLHGAFYDHFERFDIGDGIFSAEADFTSQAMMDTQPEVLEEQTRAHPHEDLVVNEQMEIENQIPVEAKYEVQMSIKEEQEVHGPSKKKTRRNVNKVIIDKQMVIPSETYHSWLKETSNICRIKKRSAKPGTDKLRSTKLDILLGLPPLCLMPTSFNEIQYPEQLLELWKKHAIGNPQTPPPTHRNINAFYPFPEESLFPDSAEIPRPVPFDIEKMREAVPGKTASSGSHDVSSRSIHSSETGFNPITFGRPSGKTQSSLSIGNLDTVVEDLDAMMPIFEFLEETGPTQTPLKEFKSSADQVTESIRSQLKSHFDISGNSTAESLNQLTDEFTRKKAAQLFYHTCVMATMDYVKVEQFVPYGDIFISRGTKM